MSHLYFERPGTVVGIRSNQCMIRFPNGISQTVPIESIESVTLLCPAQLTEQFMTVCLKKNIPVSYFSKGGTYFGRLVSTDNVNTKRQRIQCSLYDTPFALKFAERVLQAKLHNQEVILKRYARYRSVDVTDTIKTVRYNHDRISQCKQIPEMLGHEGMAAKAYFSGLSRLIDPQFAFHGRNKRPPKDPFNTLISLGYSILMNELYGRIEAKGLNPFFGLIHRDDEKHPTLASDLMEEWRAILVDATALSLLNRHELGPEDFEYKDEGCYLTKDGLATFLEKFHDKMQTQTHYLSYEKGAADFYHAINLQMDHFAKAIETEDVSCYTPVIIR